MKPDPHLTRDLKLLLEQMVAARGQYRKTFLERKIRQARRLRSENWLAALDRAVGRSIQRKRAAADLLAELTDLPEVADWFAAWLKHADPVWRAEMIEFVGTKELLQFAPLLKDGLEDEDELCRAYAVTSSGELRAETSLPAILRLAADPRKPLWNRVLWALKDYAHPLCRPTLQGVFRRASFKQDRIIAAWGLGKLGDEKAIHYLADMLDDPATETPTCYDPGESLRAAQALCDIYSWPFEWDSSWVAKTKRRWQQLHQEGNVPICVRQLGSRVEKERLDAAQALGFFVYQADNRGKAMVTALTALAASLGDSSLKVRRAAANSLVQLVTDAAAIPDGFVEKLTPALEDEDQVVRSRVGKVLKRSQMKRGG